MTGLWLTDETGTARESFAAGETVLAAGRGLQPSTLYEFRQDGAGAGLLLASLSTDRHGQLHPTVLLPYLGLTDFGRDGKSVARTFDEADKAIGGRTLTLRATAVGKTAAATALKLSVASAAKRPQVMVADSGGRLLTGCVHGESDVFVALRNFAPRCVKVFVVSRQFRWRPGDPIDPVRRRDGSPVVGTARVAADGRAVLPLWRRDELRPGSYQVIARSYQAGWFEADNDYLVPDDILSGERMS